MDHLGLGNWKRPKRPWAWHFRMHDQHWCWWHFGNLTHTVVALISLLVNWETRCLHIICYKLAHYQAVKSTCCTSSTQFCQIHTHTHTKYSAWWVFSALFLAVPGSALVCHYLPFHKLPHTSTDWPKCFCIYMLKCSKAIIGWMGWMVGWKSL